MSVALPPLGGTCALKVAVSGPGGTATACPAPRDWMAGENAQAMTQAGGWVDNAIFHNRDASTGLNCWARAVTAGIVS